MHVGDNDKLYGSVTTTIIGDALAALGVEVDRRRILMDAPIRTLGEHPVRVRLHASVIAMPLAFLCIWVVSICDQSPQAQKEREAFADQKIRSETGLGAFKPTAH